MSQFAELGKHACNQISQAGKSQLQYPLAVGQIQPTDLFCLARKLLAHTVFLKIQTNWQHLSLRIFSLKKSDLELLSTE